MLVWMNVILIFIAGCTMGVVIGTELAARTVKKEVGKALEKQADMFKVAHKEQAAMYEGFIAQYKEMLRR